MKILIITTSRFRQNGITSVIMNYYKYLIKKDIQIDIVGPNEIDAHYQSLFQEQGTTYFQLANRKKNLFKYCKRLISLMKENEYNIVHVHGSSHLIIIELACAVFAGIKRRIAHSHNTQCDHTLIHHLLTPFFNMCYTHALACGEDAGKWMFSKNDFTVINNGIDLNTYSYNEVNRVEIRRKLNVSDSTLLIGHIAGYLESKNHIYLLSIAEELLRKQVKDFKFLLLGDGQLFDEIKFKIKEKKLDNYFILTGNVVDAVRYYSAMDLFVLPSLYEGLPVVLIESQANGLTSIVSSTITKEVDKTNTIKFVPLDDLKQWGELILSPIIDRKNQSAKSCKMLEDKGYSVELNADSLYQIYCNGR